MSNGCPKHSTATKIFNVWEQYKQICSIILNIIYNYIYISRSYSYSEKRIKKDHRWCGALGKSVPSSQSPWLQRRPWYVPMDVTAGRNSTNTSVMFYPVLPQPEAEVSWGFMIGWKWNSQSGHTRTPPSIRSIRGTDQSECAWNIFHYIHISVQPSTNKWIFMDISPTGQPHRCHVVASQSSRSRQVWGQAMVQPERSLLKRWRVGMVKIHRNYLKTLLLPYEGFGGQNQAEQMIFISKITIVLERQDVHRNLNLRVGLISAFAT